MKKIGIMGGTFNPIHMVHLLMAEYVREALDLEEILFIPTGNPQYKEDQLQISAQERFKMTQLAISENPYFSVSNIEIQKQGYSYSIETMRELRKIQEEDYYFIIGEDSLLSIDSWYKCEEFLEENKIVVVSRNEDRGALNRKIGELQERGYNIFFVDMPVMELSSTMIRSRIQEQKSIYYMVPEQVRNYIETNGLYR